MKKSSVSDTVWAALDNLEYLQQSLATERKRLWNNSILLALGFSRRRKQKIARLERQVADAEADFHVLQASYVSAVSERARTAFQSSAGIMGAASEDPRSTEVIPVESFSHIASRAANLGTRDMEKCTSLALRRLEGRHIPDLQAPRMHLVPKETGK